MAFVSTKRGQFTYFSQQLGESDWRGRNVLDFGGNVGNILRDPNSTIDHERYWCIDVAKDSIQRGQASFPEAHWVFYNRYCFFFNPYGLPNLTLPELDQTFDFIVAYSVFTNTGQTDMLQLVDDLKNRLADHGAFAFTFIDPHYCSWPGEYSGNNFLWRLEREIFLEGAKGNLLEIDTQGLTMKAQQAKWCVLVNGDDLYLETEEIQAYEPESQRTYHVFYTVEYMKSLFPDAAILPPVNNEMQHCCVIRKS